jgi:MFS family permease
MSPASPDDTFAKESRFPHSIGALIVLCLTFFLVAMDNTIVNVALPTFSHTLGASTTALQWITDAYTTAFAGLIVVGGHLSD